MTDDINQAISILTLIANQHGISTRELHEKTKIPMEIIKKNLELIYQNPEMYVVSLTADDEDGTAENLADIRWYIDNIDKDARLLCLNPMERYLYKSIVTDDNNYDEFLGIMTKSTFGLDEYKYKLCQVSLAIKNNKVLKIKYKRGNEIVDLLMEPLYIVFYEFENILYVIGQYNNDIVTYRLDRIVKITETNETFKPAVNFNIDDYLAHNWGMEQGEAVQVKVLFKNEGNVFYKVKRDLHCRKNKKLTEYDDYLVYEDTVIGINSFKRWLRSYGSSAVVIEPEELKQELIESARKCLEYYKDKQ